MENSLRLTNWFSFPLCGLQTSPRGRSQAEDHGDRCDQYQHEASHLQAILPSAIARVERWQTRIPTAELRAVATSLSTFSP